MNNRGQIIQLPPQMLEFHFGADEGVISVTISTMIDSGDADTFQVLSSCHYEIQLVSVFGSRMHPYNPATLL